MIDEVLTLKLRSFVAGFRAESAALWFLCFYILLEYIRPQTMYTALDILPWGQVSLFFAVTSVFVTGCKANSYSAIDTMFTAISLLVILSGIFAWNPAASLKYWSNFGSWILMYFCIVSVLTTPNRMFIFIIFYILINFKLSQHGARSFAMRGFSFSHWGLSGSGWFHNSGELALQMAVIFAMSWNVIVASKKYVNNSVRWWILMFLFPGTSILTVIGSSSRGGQLALVAIIFILFLKTKNFFRNALLLAIVIYIGLHILPEEQIERFDSMGDDGTSQSRLVHWENALEVLSHNPLGIGYNNWRYYYSANFDIPKVEEIHNTVLQAFVELGYPGGILFLLMVITTFVMNTRTKREMDGIDDAEANAMAATARGINLGLLATFIAAFFMSVLYYPMFWLAFALTSALRNISKNKIQATMNSSTSQRRTHFQSLNERPEIEDTTTK